MSNYTKGPWKINKEGTIMTNKKNEFGHYEHLLLMGVSLTLGNHPKTEESQANARLIASAPELLEACKWAYDALKPFSKEPLEKSGIKMLEQAIAKAEGKE